MAGDDDVMESTNMHPSKSAGAMLVSVPFDGSGYRSWRREVLKALSLKSKIGSIIVKCKKLVSKTGTISGNIDDMATSWMLNSLLKDLADSLQYVNDAKELRKN